MCATVLFCIIRFFSQSSFLLIGLQLAMTKENFIVVEGVFKNTFPPNDFFPPNVRSITNSCSYSKKCLCTLNMSLIKLNTFGVLVIVFVSQAYVAVCLVRKRHYWKTRKKIKVLH